MTPRETTGESTVAREPSPGPEQSGRHPQDAESSAAAFGAFLTSPNPVAAAALRGIGRIYGRLALPLARLGAVGAAVTRDHLLFFVLAAAGMLLLAPRFLVLGRHAVETLLAARHVPVPSTAGAPYVPALLPVSVAIALVAFRIRHRLRLQVLMAAAIPVGLFLGYFDALALSLFLVFLLAAYAVICLPFDRLVAALTLTALSVAFLLVIHIVLGLGETAIGRLARAQIALIPLLWYSAYEHRSPKRRLMPWKLATFLACRFFVSPVLTYPDLFGVPRTPSHLTQVRVSGVKALYVALAAAIVGAAIGKVQNTVQPASLSGLPLLAFGYANYLDSCCRTVVRLNIFTGVLRMFGVPLRDNFNYWVLARTPNERWQRWNLLLREWVVTFVFFPIMRAKRWLFAAVMTSMLVSGVLHIAPRWLVGLSTPFVISSTLVYWTVNGLAIYAVIKVPLLFPVMVSRLRLRDSRFWSITGLVSTSAFYGALFGMQTFCENWHEAGEYFGRLLGVGAF